ncbi:Replicase polyprotein 1ab [Frankliniella fusca]|uniref:Replicase polyprotein 1ab n=1 Tax=Frankliniella fusca TaxID=407009 RepID=A0AAE1LMH5_9NEOP|nr:Replicase polyprotein 1ab [Frankliniella fusca]
MTEIIQVFVRENRPYCETHLELLSLQRKTQKKLPRFSSSDTGELITTGNLLITSAVSGSGRAQTLRCCKFDEGISSNSTLPDRRTHSPHLQNIVIL